MSISAEERNRYLSEAAIVLTKEGFQSDEIHADRLCILLDGAPLCEVTDITSSSFHSAAFACTSAATSATCWRYMLRHIRKSCLARRVVADGSICRHDRKSRGNCAF